jgi:excinuclease ABC subunit C
MIDESGELIYVGKAKCLRARLLSYFRPRSRDPKAGRILRHTRALAWEFVPTEFAALLRELELIRRWRPRWNVLGQPGRHGRTFICLGGRPAPYLYLSTRPPATALAVFGPVVSGGRAREAVRRCNDWFRLRDCPQAQEMIFAEENKLFPIVRAAGCIRHEIGTCAGPCAAACSRTSYARQVQAARRFLDGRGAEPVEALEREMQAASAALAFERAAALRDQLDSLRWLARQLQRLREAQGAGCVVYPVVGHGGERLWYVLCRGLVMAAVPQPVDRAGGEKAGEIITGLERRRHKMAAGPHEFSAVLLVSAWFRRFPKEQARLLSAAEALKICRTAAKS